MSQLTAILLGTALAIIGYTIKAIREINRDRENGGDGCGGEDMRPYYLYTLYRLSGSHRRPCCPRRQRRPHRSTDTAASSPRVMTGASRRTGNHCRLSKRRERRLISIAPLT